jgi:tetratricopeptide (TPR) repeat protein
MNDEAISREKPVTQAQIQKWIVRALNRGDSDEQETGLALLHRHRWRLEEVPAAYDAAIGRLSLLAGLVDDAVEYLFRAKKACDGAMHQDWWRCLADALLRAGRVEAAGQELSELREAGGKIISESHLAALEAFARKRGTEIDKGPPTPWRILAQAEMLAEIKHRVAAPRLLAENRGKFTVLPKAYDAALCRLALRCGDGKVAVECLTRARDESRGAVPVIIRQSLGTALFNIGEVDTAAAELSAAMAEGAEITRLDFRIAIASYRANEGAGEMIDTSFPRALTLVDHDKKLVYLSLPKNACTLLKATFVMNTSHREAYLAAGRPIHEFCTTITKSPLPHETIMGEDYFRFVVLRDPLKRVLSAYLDKFVRRRKARDRSLRVQQMNSIIRGAQDLAGLPFDPVRSISFTEFVRYLAIADDTEFNMHWMPQSRSVGTDLSIYNHVGKMENLQHTLDLLETRFGFVHEKLNKQHMPVARRHVSKFSDNVELDEPFNRLPQELDAYEQGLPKPERFFTPELQAILRQRYAADVMLYESIG